MNYKQNEKINQVKESTLVVGIDIGSTTQYARAFDWRGIELGKVFPFSNSREGFESFKAWMQHLQDKYKKLDAIVGIEPTGHYWFDLGAYLEDEGILLVMVNPYAVKQTKELDDNSQSKNDRKDPKVIAKLVTEGRYSAPYTPDGVYADLRIKVKEYAEQGYTFAVVLDLSKYFDTLNHEILINLLRKNVKDERVVQLIKRYLKSGVMENGVVIDTEEGSPQGGNLSPLLANVYLNEFDQEFLKRGVPCIA